MELSAYKTSSGTGTAVAGVLKASGIVLVSVEEMKC